MKDKLAMYLGIYISFLLVFNEFLGIYLSKTVLRGIYIFFIFFILVCRLFYKEFKLYSSKMDIIIFLYILYMIFRYSSQVIFARTTEASHISFLQTIIPILVYYVAKEINDEMSKVIEKFFCILATISVLCGLVDSRIKFLPRIGTFMGGLYTGIGGEYVLRGYSLAGNALITGFICTLGLSFILMNKWNSKREKISRCVIIVVLFMGLLSSLSRGAFFMLIITLIASYLYKFSNHEMTINPQKAIVLCAVLAFFVFILILKWEDIINMSSVRRFFKVGLDITERSNSLRLEYQKKALEEAIKNPLYGIGFGYTGIHALSLNSIKWINTESYILTRLICGGIIDCGLFVFIFLKTVFNKKLYLKKSMYLSILIGMFVWSILYILLDSDLTAVFYWYCLGRVYNYGGMYAYQEKKMNKSEKAMFAVNSIINY